MRCMPSLSIYIVHFSFGCNVHSIHCMWIDLMSMLELCQYFEKLRKRTETVAFTSKFGEKPTSVKTIHVCNRSLLFLLVQVKLVQHAPCTSFHKQFSMSTQTVLNATYSSMCKVDKVKAKTCFQSHQKGRHVSEFFHGLMNHQSVKYLNQNTSDRCIKNIKTPQMNRRIVVSPLLEIVLLYFLVSVLKYMQKTRNGWWKMFLSENWTFLHQMRRLDGWSPVKLLD